MTAAKIEQKKWWIKLKEEPNIQHQFLKTQKKLFSTKYLKIPTVTQFSLQCTKKATCSKQFLENEKTRWLFR